MSLWSEMCVCLPQEVDMSLWSETCVPQEVDMSLLLGASPERGRVAEWTVPLEYWYNSLAVRRGSPNTALTAFLTPFHWTVRVCPCSLSMSG